MHRPVTAGNDLNAEQMAANALALIRRRFKVVQQCAARTAPFSISNQRVALPINQIVCTAIKMGGCTLVSGCTELNVQRLHVKRVRFELKRFIKVASDLVRLLGPELAVNFNNFDRGLFHTDANTPLPISSVLHGQARRAPHWNPFVWVWVRNIFDDVQFCHWPCLRERQFCSKLFG